MSEFRRPRQDRAPSRRRRPRGGGTHSGISGRKSADPGRWLYGRRTVTAALANPERRWHHIAVLAGHEQEALPLVAGARAVWHGHDEPLRVLDQSGFTAILPEGAVHQGLALEVEPLAGRDLDDVLRQARQAAGRAVIVVLDRVSDPQNIGAVLGSAAPF